MRKHSWARTGVAAVLTASLSVACVPQVLALAADEAADAAAAREAEQAAADAAANPPASTARFEKAEVVYAALDAHGAPRAAYVVNRFEVDEAGTVVDFGGYDSVLNMTDTSALSYNEVGEFTMFDVEPGTFSYQGTMNDVVLPWSIDIAYELDGRSVTPDELAGATGKLAVRVTTQRNDAFAQAPSFYDSFMLQITFTLPGEACAHVAADGATVAVSGSDRTVAFTVLPGSDGDFALTADVTDFHMDGATIAALPYSSVVEMPDTSGVAGGLGTLAGAVSQLASGANELAAGASELAGASAQINAGLSQMEDMIPADLQESIDALGSIDIDPDQIDQIGNYLDGIIEQLEALKGRVEESADDAAQDVERYRQLLAAIKEAIEDLGAHAPSEGEVAALREFVADDLDQAATVEKLVSSLDAAEDLRSFLDQIEGLIGSADVPSLDEIDATAALDQMITSLKSLRMQLDAVGSLSDMGDVSALVQGLAQLKEFAAQYGQFDSGLAAYATGVSTYANGVAQLDAATSALPDEMQAQIDEMMASYDFPAFDGTSFAAPGRQTVSEVQFVMTTAAIEVPVVEEEAVEEEELTIIDRFFALFE